MKTTVLKSIFWHLYILIEIGTGNYSNLTQMVANLMVAWINNIEPHFCQSPFMFVNSRSKNLTRIIMVLIRLLHTLICTETCLRYWLNWHSLDCLCFERVEWQQAAVCHYYSKRTEQMEHKTAKEIQEKIRREEICVKARTNAFLCLKLKSLHCSCIYSSLWDYFLMKLLAGTGGKKSLVFFLNLGT